MNTETPTDETKAPTAVASSDLLGELTDMLVQAEDRVLRLQRGEYGKWHDAVLDAAAIGRTITIIRASSPNDALCRPADSEAGAQGNQSK